MVLPSNDGVSGDNMNNRPLEDGFIIKYKRRKVSAVREFPPNCGPVDLRPGENSHDYVDISEPSTTRSSETPTGDCDKTSELPNVPEADVNAGSAEDLVNTPVEMEDNNKPLDAFVGNIETISADKLGGSLEGKTIPVKAPRTALPDLEDILMKEVNEETAAGIMEAAKVEIEVHASVDGMDLVGGSMSLLPSQGPNCNTRLKKETSLARPKDKYRRRRISAVRDFPPSCGKNASQPTLDEQQRIMPGGDVGTHVVNTSVDGMERNASGELLTSSKNECSDGVEKGDEEMEATETLEHRSPAEILVDNSRTRDLQGALKGNITNDILGEENTSRGYVCPGDNEAEHRVVVHGLTSAKSSGEISGGKVKQNAAGDQSGGKVKHNESWRKNKAVAKKSVHKGERSGGSMLRKKTLPVSSDADGTPGATTTQANKDYGANDEELPDNSPPSHEPRNFDVTLPPFGPNTSNHGDARNRVRETLRLFNAVCRKLLQGEEAKSRPEEDGNSKQKQSKRIDLLAAKIIKEKGKEVNTGGKFVGAVPGVEVGDEFQYRVELAVVGIHRLYQGGIDYIKKKNGVIIAVSIVASGGYDDDTENADVLIYSGQGGNATGKDKQPEDQKLERGNLALSNSIMEGNPVRVVRGWKETRTSDSVDSRAKVVTTYIYDGLYTVKNYWTQTGAHGKQVFMFELRRNPGQPELAWKELRKSTKSEPREGVCVDDISEGKEKIPICAVNMIDNERPPPFTYISKMMYPDWYSPIAPAGCDCTGRCSSSRKCKCTAKNGGDIPYNRNGAIVEVKPLVYECGPLCKCPPSCYNRVSQQGIRFRLEIFKTESRGWGVRSLNSIPSGSFICEYAGELLEDREAEQRIGNDEYLFDIGQNYSDSSLKPDEQAKLTELEEGSYTIDAAQYGNVGRFINHSCSPNLYAQNVIYDHDDKRIPHVMLFAAENVPPLQELTYHYNYSIDQVHDTDGNIKVKRCYCGSAECTGRLY